MKDILPFGNLFYTLNIYRICVKLERRETGNRSKIATTNKQIGR